ncbi:MAG: hypothetical protein R3F43_13630 [bacterium]
MPGPPGPRSGRTPAASWTCSSAASGTGATITGVGRFSRRRTLVHIVAVEPATSLVLAGGRPGAHQIQGIGAGFVPPVLDRGVVMIRHCHRRGGSISPRPALEGIPAGISSGAACQAALAVAARPAFAGATIVTLFASAAERYLSTRLYRDLVRS